MAFSDLPGTPVSRDSIDTAWGLALLWLVPLAGVVAALILG